MAQPNGHFYIQKRLAESAPHHESFEQLWATKWKEPVRWNDLNVPDMVSDDAIGDERVIPVHVRIREGL